MAKKPKIETKVFGGKITETKEIDRNGIPIGIISGYIATWDVDRGGYIRPDQFVKGAFAESLNDHLSKNRQIRFKDNHYGVIGGFPIETAKEDERGLFAIGEVNLETQAGREAFSLAKQGVLVDFSVGFSALEWEIKEDIRVISKAIIWEGSIVDEPMNPEANVTEVKSINAEEYKTMSERDIEGALIAGAKFSSESAKTIVSAIKAIRLRDEEGKARRDGGNGDDWDAVISELKTINKKLEG